MPNPSLTVEMGFGYTWKDAPSTISWTDVSSYVRDVNIRRGSSDPLRSFEAGSATVVLDNGDGFFNPNTEGPYLGQIKPRVPIRISGTYTTPTRTNLITNPSFETNTTGWAAGSNTTISQDSADELQLGSYSLKVASTSASSATSSVSTSPRVSVTAGGDYTLSCFIKVYSFTGTTRRIGIQWFNSGGTAISSSTQTYNGELLWQRISVSAPAPAGAVTARCYVEVDGMDTGQTVPYFYLDGFLFEGSYTLKNYFDGTFAGCSWTGTAHASTSQQTTTTYRLFTGFVQEFPFSYPAMGNDAIVSLNCIDGLAIIGSADLPDTPVLTSQALGTYATDANTKAYFRLGDSGTVVVDSSSGGQNMNATGTVVTGSALSGLVGLSSQFAADWYAQGAYLADKTTFTEWWQVSFWVQTSVAAASGAARVLLEVATPSSDPTSTYNVNLFGVYVRSTGALEAVLATQAGSYRQSRTSTGITDGQPHHVTISFYAITTPTTGAQQQLTIYLDGVDVTTAVTTSSAKHNFYGTVTIGNANSTLTSAWYNTYLGLNPIGFVGNIQDLAFNYFGATSPGGNYAAELYGYGSGQLPETSAARISRVLNIIGWNTTDRDISTTPYTSVAGWTLGENALSHLQTVTEGEHSKLWIEADGTIAFTDRYAQSTRTRSRNLQMYFSDQTQYWDKTRIGYSGLDWNYTAEQTINSFTVTAQDGNQQTDFDQADINSYGERAQSLSTYLSSTAQALALAQMVVYENSDASIMPSAFVVRPGTYPLLEYPAMLNLELMDRIKVWFGNEFEIGYQIPSLGVNSLLQSIDLSITPSQWIWTLACTGRTEPMNYFRLDIDALDGPQVLGF